MNKVIRKWQDKNGDFWCLMAYWLGTGYQYSELLQITKELFDKLTVDTK